MNKSRRGEGFKNDMRPIKRVLPKQSYQLARSSREEFRRECQRPWEEISMMKHVSKQEYHRPLPTPKLHHADTSHRKKPYSSLTERVREREREREWNSPELFELRQNTDETSLPRQGMAPWRSSSSRSISCRDKDKQPAVRLSERKQSRERDHNRNRSEDRAQSGDPELLLSSAQEAARTRAIQEKRKEIEKVYYHQSEMFHTVVKMLIEKDPSLNHLIQTSFRANLRDIGARCLKAMERFIEEYDLGSGVAN